MASVAWEMYVVMHEGKPVAVFAKDPAAPSVVNITEDLAQLFMDNQQKKGESQP